MFDVTYFEAAVEILRTARRPLTVREIVEQAQARGLLTPRGRTPEASMSAELYRRLGKDSAIVKVAQPGNVRALRGSVRWELARLTA